MKTHLKMEERRKMKAVIVDDGQCARGNLEILLTKWTQGVTVVGMANSVKNGLTLVEQAQPEVIFLDAELSDGTGFDFIKHMPVGNRRVIFCTAHDQYVIKALRKGALDYLLKPVDIIELQGVVNRAWESLNETAAAMPRTAQQEGRYAANNKLVVSDKNNIYLIDLPDILYCKGEGNYTTFHLRDGSSVVISKHLKTYEKLLLRARFFRVHTSFIVSLKEVKRIVKGTADLLVMSNGDEVPMATRRKTDVISALTA